MKLIFFNNSNADIILKWNHSTNKISAQNSQILDCNENEVRIQLLPAGNSHLKRIGKTVVGYHFYVESSYHIVTEHDTCRITLNVIGTDGDHFEYYLRAVPLSDTAKFILEEYTIPDKQNIMDSVINNYNQRQTRNARNRKKWKKGNSFSEIILDTVYSALPIIIFVYIFAHNHISKTAMILLMFALWIFVILMMQLIYRLYDKIAKKTNKEQNTPVKEQFDIMSIFESNYIDFITSDNERYQNKK